MEDCDADSSSGCHGELRKCLIWFKCGQRKLILKEDGRLRDPRRLTQALPLRPSPDARSALPNRLCYRRAGSRTTLELKVCSITLSLGCSEKGSGKG